MLKALVQLFPLSRVNHSGAAPDWPGFVQVNPENAVSAIWLASSGSMAILGSPSRNVSVAESVGSVLLTTTSRTKILGNIGVPVCTAERAGLPPGFRSSAVEFRVYTVLSGGMLG